MKNNLIILPLLLIILSNACTKSLKKTQEDKNRTKEIINKYFVSVEKNQYNMLFPYLYDNEYNITNEYFIKIRKKIIGKNYKDYSVIYEEYRYEPIPSDIPPYIYEKSVKFLDNSKNNYELFFMFVKKNKNDKLLLIHIDLWINKKHFSLE